MGEEASRPEIYPRYCFHLSPTVNTWCLLRATEIHGLEQHAGFQGENFFFYRNLPIKWVRVVGVVVAIDDFAGRRVFTVDDGSGACIEALVAEGPVQPAAGTANAGAGAGAAHPRPPYEDLDVGAVVDVKGGLSTFRDEKQIKTERLVRLRGTAQEVALWEKRARFRRDVLDKPWVLGSRDIRRCRREAESSGARRERRLAPTLGRGAEAQRQDAGSKRPSRRELAVDLTEAIRTGAIKGKYNALGL